MDSLKIPKGGNSSVGTKPSGSVPITVRFNAGDECIDDIFQSFHNNSNSGGTVGGGGGGGGGGGDSLSSSPSQQPQQQHQQNADEVNTRNNFLQGNFFNRKRSGSCEGNSPTAVGPNLIAALSSSDTNSVGTWKLIKGKVTQTIEDIKLSKSNNQPTLLTPKGDHQAAHDPDSDPENAAINYSSVSDELSLEQELRTLQQKATESDSDIENEELLFEGDIERSRLRRGIANLKSKVKAKSAAHHLHHHHQHPSSSSLSALSTLAASTGAKTMSKDSSPSRSEGTSNTSLRSTFLRKRRKQPVETAELATPSNTLPTTVLSVSSVPIASGSNPKPEKEKKKKGIISGKKEVEIESGVEMLEDMVPPPPENAAATGADPADGLNKRQSMELLLQSRSSSEQFDGAPSRSNDYFTGANAGSTNLESSVILTQIGNPFSRSSFSFKSFLPSESSLIVKQTASRIPIFTLLGLAVVMFLPLPEFLRGVLACLLTIALLESVWTQVQDFIVRRLTSTEPERVPFTLPDYSKMSICEIPAVEEHKTVKTYAGWMNEVNSYDPKDFHISMSKSVYVKLDGTFLRISNTTARVPKRIMWNETPIDRNTIQFTQHRTYNLLGCRIELLPLGLARKRYFNRKYPIQLIIKHGAETRIDDGSYPVGGLPSASSKRPSTGSAKDDSDYGKFFDPKDSSTLLLSAPTTTLTNQNSSESLDDRSERSMVDPESEMDFAATIMNADLQSLQDTANPDVDNKDISVPCGDETRLLLFSRSDREKEDWYRRFVAASLGDVNDQDLRLPNVRLVEDNDIQAAAVKAALLLTDATNGASTQSATSNSNDDSKTTAPAENSIPTVVDKADKETFEDIEDDLDESTVPDDTFEGLLMSSCAARNPADYIRFMALYQRACNQSHIPVYKQVDTKVMPRSKRHRRAKQQEDELWKGIDQSLFLGPSGSVVWTNVLIGRVLYSCLKDVVLQGKIQEFLQKKLSSIKLPSFMEDVVITQINLGDTPPLIHRISRPMLDERGTWVDADVTYEGLLHITVTTKLNLLRLKRQGRAHMSVDTPGGTPTANNLPPINVIPDESATSSSTSMSLQEEQLADALSGSAIFDSDAESSGGSSSESDSPIPGGTDTTNAEYNVFNTSPGNARRIFKIVDRFTASNFFQYATELSYVQRAMENMNANITLRVELKGLVSRATINIPPPPSDRVWLAFRGPPRLWISAKPAVGEKSFDWSIVTNVIENKLCEEVNKYLVYPNMVDVTIPFLGQPTYKE